MEIKQLIEEYENQTGKKAFEFNYKHNGENGETLYKQLFVYWLVEKLK